MALILFIILLFVYPPLAIIWLLILAFIKLNKK